MRRIAFLIVSILYFTACNNDMIDNSGITNDGSIPQIKLFLPDAQTVNLYSTATPSENTIDTIWVIAFNGNTKQWVEKIPGNDIVRNSEAFQLLPQLSHLPQIGWNGWKFVCIANVAPNPDTSTVNLTPATINNCFKIVGPTGALNSPKGYYAGGDYLPMYGEFIWSSSGGYTCVMERAVAKVQVQMGASVSDVTGNFTAENVIFKVLNSGYAGKIQPTSPMEYIPYPSSLPHTNYLHNVGEEFFMLQKSTATELNTNIYLFEFPTHNRDFYGRPINNESVFDSCRQHLMLYKVNAVADTSYYRLEFYNPVTEKYLETKRNHHYLFTINKVRSEGYKTFTEALYNHGSNIEYTVEIKDGANNITSNGQYAIVTISSLDTIYFRGSPGGSQSVVTARYQLPIEINALAPGTLNSIDVEVLSPGADSDAFSNVSPNYFNNPNTNYPIYVTIKSNTVAGTVGALNFHVGNITHRVIFRYVPAS